MTHKQALKKLLEIENLTEKDKTRLHVFYIMWQWFAIIFTLYAFYLTLKELSFYWLGFTLLSLYLAREGFLRVTLMEIATHDPMKKYRR